MSSTSERTTDLFIPVGRPRSSTSSEMTRSSAHTATATATLQSGSTTPSTVSSRQSAPNTNLQKTNKNPSSGIRYVISASPQNVTSNKPEPVPLTKAADEPSSSVHFRRHSRELSAPVSPIKELTMRLSRVTGSRTANIDFSPRSKGVRPSVTITRAPPSSGYAFNDFAPTPFTSPEMTSGQSEGPIVQKSRTRRLSIDSALRHDVLSSPENQRVSTEVPSPTRAGALSRSSSRSDRSFPPTSFPQEFSEKNVIQKIAHRALFRSHSTKSVSSNKSSRSISPLKFEIRGDKSGTTNSALREVQQHPPRTPSSSSRRHQIVADGETVKTTSPENNSVFHTTIHYYTSCDHTSPPSTRPLNIQPVLDENYQPARSTISGMCFECDTEYRRNMETSTLYSFNPRITAHMADLSTIVSRLEGLSPVSPLSPVIAPQRPDHSSLTQSLTATLDFLRIGDDEGAKAINRQGSISSLVSEDDDIESTAIRVQALEDRIAELTLTRDIEVREIWKGYTQRWGPGTLGVVKSPEAIRSVIGTPRSGLSSGRISINSERSVQGTPPGRMKVDWIRDREE